MCKLVRNVFGVANRYSAFHHRLPDNSAFFCASAFHYRRSRSRLICMNSVLADSSPVATTTISPQQQLAGILDSLQPDTLLIVSMNPIPALDAWCADNDCALTWIAELDPLAALADTQRFDLVVIADQLEYMNRHSGEELLGLVRHLHSDAMLVLYQPALAPQKLRWQLSDFLGMGMRRQQQFSDGERSMSLYSYELDSYNFTRSWNNSRFWANPENWGKYWW